MLQEPLGSTGEILGEDVVFSVTRRDDLSQIAWASGQTANFWIWKFVGAVWAAAYVAAHCCLKN